MVFISDATLKLPEQEFFLFCRVPYLVVIGSSTDYFVWRRDNEKSPRAQTLQFYTFMQYNYVNPVFMR